MGGTGKLSLSPLKSGARRYGVGKSKLTEMMDVPMEMVGRESVVVTWNLGMQGGGGEVSKCLQNKGELTGLHMLNCRRSHVQTKLLPRSIYLSHQFSFHTLGEDYHALFRRYQLDISGHKIAVRKEVQVGAYFVGSGESFVEGFSLPRDIWDRTLSLSFDEPLASALTGGLDYHHSPGVLPMLPNGVPGAQSFHSSIPIHTMTGIGDGMSEGLGRIRREINRVREARPEVASNLVPHLLRLLLVCNPWMTKTYRIMNLMHGMGG